MSGGRASKEKGARFERELAEWLSRTLGISASRAPLSGDGVVNLNAGGADIIGTPMIFIEAKRTERLNVRDALAQAVGNVAKRKTPDLPAVITRRNREQIEDALVVMRLADWSRLYAALLREEGFSR